MFSIEAKHREEAERLLALDEHGQRVEILAQMVAMLEGAQASQRELATLDKEALRVFLAREGGGDIAEVEEPAG